MTNISHTTPNFLDAVLTRLNKCSFAGGCKETPEEMDGMIRSEYKGRG